MKHKWKLDEHGKPDEWVWEIGFCNGVYCERCGKYVCIHCNPLWEELDDCMEPPKPKPKTNADRIRAMSDEELGIFLAEWADKPWAWKRDGEGECLAWLKEPAEEGGLCATLF